ncbi:MAG: DNA polymerase Y family protein [Nitrosospira sp.]|nr:DNA polymerase Y family protein [Nitrosospira sp.]
MLWIALHCPALSLDWIERRFPAALAPAMAVTVRRGNQVYIRQANKPARKRGVTAHQPLASALALLPDLVVVEHDPNEEMKALHEAAYAALHFTPNIVLQCSGLIAEVSASLKLFGGLKKLCQLLNRAVSAQGLQLCVGVAPTAKGAWLLARSAPSRTVINGTGAKFRSLLDSLPVSLLESAQPHLEVIGGIGCRTLADLQRLPRDGIARRFGPDLLIEMDRAYGDSPDPQRWFETPESFEQKMRLMALVESVELLLVPAQRMIDQMCGWLTSRHAEVSTFSFILHHEYSLRQPCQSTSISVRLSEQSCDPGHLKILLRERLGRTKLVAPVCELALIADEITAGANANMELFPTAQSEATSLNRFIEKLSSRLGPQAVTSLRIIPDHRPECSQRFEAPGTGEMSGVKNASRRETPWKTIPRELTRPAWLIETPLELKLQRQQQVQPVYGTPLKLIAGPERIEAGWWDDAPIARDYFIAENGLGQLLWIYREHNPTAKNHRWYLQGLFG